MVDHYMKPCPFPVCGANDSDIYAENSLKGDGSIGYAVRCKVCHSQGPTRDFPDEAAEAWNAREWDASHGGFCRPETCGHESATKHIDCPDIWHKTPGPDVAFSCPTCRAS